MKKTLLLFGLTVLLFNFFSCNDEPPVLPGLAKSYLNIQSSPDSAKIIFNNDETGKITPDILQELDPGFYKIDLVKDTYLDTIIYYIIERNVIDTISIELREDPSYWWTNYNTNNSPLPTNIVKNIVFDAQNNIWIGTSGHGVAVLDASETNWTFYNKDNSGLPGNVVNSLLWENDKVLWLGTDRGVARYDGASWRTYTPDNSDMPDEYITSLEMDASGNLWIGTYNMGLVRFDGVNFINYNIYNSNIPSNIVQCLKIDPQGGIWVGTWGGGLGKFEQGLWDYYRLSSGDILSDFVSDIEFDNTGNVIVSCGTIFYPGGLCVFDGSSFTNYRTEFPSGIVSGVAVSKNNIIWVSTGEEGLVRYDGSSFTYYNVDNSGLPSNAVGGVTIDADGNKWMRSNGLTKYIGGE